VADTRSKATAAERLKAMPTYFVTQVAFLSSSAASAVGGVVHALTLERVTTDSPDNTHTYSVTPMASLPSAAASVLGEVIHAPMAERETTSSPDDTTADSLIPVVSLPSAAAAKVGEVVHAHTAERETTASLEDATAVVSHQSAAASSRRWMFSRYKWEPEEDIRLTVAVQELGYNWVSVAMMVPDRTEKECCSRWIQKLRPTHEVKGEGPPTEASASSTEDQGIFHLSESIITIRGLLVALAKEKDVANGMAESVVQRIEAGVERHSVLKVNTESETVALKRQFDKVSREELLALLRHLNVGKFEEAWKDKLGKYRLGGEPLLKTGNNAPKCEVKELLLAYLDLDSETQTVGPPTDGIKDKWTPTEALTSMTHEEKDRGQRLLDFNEVIMQLSESVMTIRGLLVTLDKEKDVADVLLENIDQCVVAGSKRLSILIGSAEIETVALKRQFDNLTREELLAVLRHLAKEKFDRNMFGGELRIKTGNAPRRESTERVVASLNLDSLAQTVGNTVNGMKDNRTFTEESTSRTQENKEGGQRLLGIDEGIMRLSGSVMTIRGLLVTLDNEKDVAHALLENIDQHVVAGVERLSILR
jgi:hypothetical protein